MNLSKYCKIYSEPDDPGSVILFSTKSASKIAIPKSMLDDINRNNLSEEERESLSELGFLAKDDDEDRAGMLAFVDELNTVDKLFFAKLVMNLDCNLACRYCFEGTRKGSYYMSKETAELFLQFLKTEVLPGKEEIKITFYGGEPLLSKNLILSVSESIKFFARKRGLKYSALLVTNGTLLTPQTVRLLEPSGISAASITLDGPESIHDSSRPFRNGKGSYQTIVKNLKEVCEIIDLQIGGNYTKGNYQRFPELLDVLLDEGLTPDRISSIQFYPVIQEVEGIVNYDFNDGCNLINEPWLFEAENFLREEILKRGYRTSKVIPSVCMVELKDRMVINYDGSIYKCPGLLGREEYKVGDIKNGIRDHRTSHNLDSWKNEECLDCAYLPLCFGGCRYSKMLRDGNMDGVDCKKPYLDATLERAVKQDIRYGLKA